MRPFETLDRVSTPGGRELSLHRRGDDYYIHLDGEELMSTRVHGSESALADVACGELAPESAPRILIGGLGLGFTLQAALAALPVQAAVMVAELVPKVVEWNRQYLPSSARALDDSRVRIELGDVARVVHEAPRRSLHAVLLDVDNGPSAFCFASNRGLYDQQGLGQLERIIAPGGILAVWSAYEDAGFVKRLTQAGFKARKQLARGHGPKGRRHTIFLGRVPG